MAEPKNLEEALDWYLENKFSRKHVLKFAVDRIKAVEMAQESLRGQLGDLMAILVRERGTAAPEPADAKLTQSEKMKAYWAQRKAQAVADGVAEAANG